MRSTTLIAAAALLALASTAVAQSTPPPAPIPPAQSCLPGQHPGTGPVTYAPSAFTEDMDLPVQPAKITDPNAFMPPTPIVPDDDDGDDPRDTPPRRLSMAKRSTLRTTRSST